MFIVIGLGCSPFIARTYSARAPRHRMGPGFFPFYLGLIMAGFWAWSSWSISCRKEGQPVGQFHWRPIFWVLGSIVMFGVIAQGGRDAGGGLRPGIGSRVIGGDEFKLKGMLILGSRPGGLLRAGVRIGLKLPIPMCPDIEWFQQFTALQGMTP